MGNTSEDLTRELYRRMSSRELMSLRDKMHTAGEHAPYILAELKRRGLPSTPQQPQKYQPRRMDSPARAPRERSSRARPRRQQPPPENRPAPGTGNRPRVQAPGGFGQQSGVRAPASPQDLLQQNRPAQRQAPPTRSSAQRQARPSIPIVRAPDKKSSSKGCGCAIMVIIFILIVIFNMLAQHR